MDNDFFWNEQELMLSTSLMSYIWMMEPQDKQNIHTFVELLDKIQVIDGKNSEMTKLFEDFAEKYGKDHPAYVNYQKVTKNTNETLKNMIIDLKVKF